MYDTKSSYGSEDLGIAWPQEPLHPQALAPDDYSLQHPLETSNDPYDYPEDEGSDFATGLGYLTLNETTDGGFADQSQNYTYENDQSTFDEGPKASSFDPYDYRGHQGDGVAAGMESQTLNEIADGTFADEVGTSTTIAIRQKYRNVKVILMRWKDEGDLKCAKEVDALEVVFRNYYNFSVQQYLIGYHGSNTSGRVVKWLEEYLAGCSSQDSLVIFYYGGHGGRPATTKPGTSGSSLKLCRYGGFVKAFYTN
jgi:hypothetical protein